MSTQAPYNNSVLFPPLQNSYSVNAKPPFSRAERVNSCIKNSPRTVGVVAAAIGLLALNTVGIMGIGFHVEGTKGIIPGAIVGAEIGGILGGSVLAIAGSIKLIGFLVNRCQRPHQQMAEQATLNRLV